MDLIVKDNLISFKDLEQKIFHYVCEVGREITQLMLERYDNERSDTIPECSKGSKERRERESLCR